MIRWIVAIVRIRNDLRDAFSALPFQEHTPDAEPSRF